MVPIWANPPTFEKVNCCKEWKSPKVRLSSVDQMAEILSILGSFKRMPEGDTDG